MDFVYYGKLLSKNKMDSLSGEVLMKAFEMDTTQDRIAEPGDLILYQR
ncbi:MAG: hypothetical protein MZV64_24480 [Ignavibacteriales bacterium]|nr:hypothetical protein [Ignavibacteriales bacterium]